MKYSKERREAVLRKLLMPENRPLAQFAAEEGSRNSRIPLARN
jgi:hypothetical protein